jgi:hypothetical protein
MSPLQSIEGGRDWDISTEEMAHFSLQRVKLSGTPNERKMVYRAVMKQYPGLPQCKIGYGAWEREKCAGLGIPDVK